MIRARTERELVVAPSNKTVQANNHDKKVTDTLRQRQTKNHRE